MTIMSMSKTLIKSLFHGPYTRPYPLKKKEYFDRTRGKIGINIDDCLFCGMCQRRCPTGAIKVEKAKSAWSIDRFKCIQCNYCAETCPKKCLVMKNEYTSPAFGDVKDEYARVSDNKENS